MLWVQYCVHSSFLYILPPSSQTFLRNRSPGQQQQQQKTTTPTPTTNNNNKKQQQQHLKRSQDAFWTQYKVWSLKKYFRSILNVLSFAVFILDVCALAFFCWDFVPCLLLVRVSCYIFTFDCFFSYLEKYFELLHHDYFCFTAQAFFTVQMTTINVWFYGFAFTVYRQLNLKFVTYYGTGQTTFYISPLSNIHLTPC